MLRYANLCINHLRTQTTTLLSNRTNVLTQLTRNTYILKRKFVPPLRRKNQRQPPLKPKYFIYELVENTISQKQKLIDVILLESVATFGLKGQKISVPSEKAYNRLLLPKLAVYPTPENVEKYLIEDTTVETESERKSSKHIERTLNLLSQLYLNVVMSSHVPWTIEKWHIRVSFRKQGFIVPDDAITLSDRTISGPDLLLEGKEFYVTVKVNNREEVKVRCKIFHFKNDVEDQNIPKEPVWSLPNIAIFPEDQPILDSLPKHRLYKERTNDISE